MANRVLVSLDHSEGAWRALRYAAQTFGKGSEITLLHILSNLPPSFWDDGHILKGKEYEERRQLVAKWKEDQKRINLKLIDKARELLISSGFPPEAIKDDFRPLSVGVAEDIIDEAMTRGVDTIVMGRRGLGMAKSLLLGSVTQKVVQYARGCAVVVVE